MIIKHKLILCLLLTLTLFAAGLMFAASVEALSCDTAGTGDWSTTGTWQNCGGGVPGTNDSVTINAGHTVTVSSNVTQRAAITINGTVTVNIGIILRQQSTGGASGGNPVPAMTIGSNGSLAGLGTFTRRSVSNTDSAMVDNSTNGITISNYQYIFYPEDWPVPNPAATYVNNGIITGTYYGGNLIFSTVCCGWPDLTFGIASGTLTVGQDLVITQSDVGAIMTLDNTPNDNTIIIGGNLDVGESNMAGTFKTGNATVTIGGDVTIPDGDGAQCSGCDNTLDASDGTPTINVGGDWDLSGGTFTYGTSTVVLNGTGNLAVPGFAIFYNLELAKNGQITTVTTASDLNVAGVLNIGPGEFASSANFDLWLRPVSGITTPLVLDSSANITTNRRLRIVPPASNSATINVPGGNYGSLTSINVGARANNTFQLTGDLTASDANFGVAAWSSATTFNTQGNALNVKGFAFLDENCSCGPGIIATANFNGSTVTIGTNGLRAYSSPSGGDYSLQLGNSSVSCAGQWNLVNGSSSVTQNAGTSTVTFNGTGPQSITSNGNAFNDVVITNSSDTVTFTDDMTAMNFTCTAPSADIKFNAGSTYSITNLIVQGSSGGLITLGSTSPGSRWNLNVSGIHFVSYVQVSDSDASGGSTINCANCIEPADNNINWNFLSPVPTMTQWGMIVFIMLAGFGAVYYLRRRRYNE